MTLARRSCSRRAIRSPTSRCATPLFFSFGKGGDDVGPQYRHSRWWPSIEKLPRHAARAHAYAHQKGRSTAPNTKSLSLQRLGTKRLGSDKGWVRPTLGTRCSLFIREHIEQAAAQQLASDISHKPIGQRACIPLRPVPLRPTLYGIPSSAPPRQ